MLNFAQRKFAHEEAKTVSGDDNMTKIGKTTDFMA